MNFDYPYLYKISLTSAWKLNDLYKFTRYNNGNF